MIEPQEIITQDYRIAPSGDGPQAFEWLDKPHRLVYDLCSEIDRLRKVISDLEEVEQLQADNADLLVGCRVYTGRLSSFNLSDQDRQSLTRAIKLCKKE